MVGVKVGNVCARVGCQGFGQRRWAQGVSFPGHSPNRSRLRRSIIALIAADRAGIMPRHWPWVNMRRLAAHHTAYGLVILEAVIHIR